MERLLSPTRTSKTSLPRVADLERSQEWTSLAENINNLEQFYPQNRVKMRNTTEQSPQKHLVHRRSMPEPGKTSLIFVDVNTSDFTDLSRPNNGNYLTQHDETLKDESFSWKPASEMEKTYYRNNNYELFNYNETERTAPNNSEPKFQEIQNQRNTYDKDSVHRSPWSEGSGGHQEKGKNAVFEKKSAGKMNNNVNQLKNEESQYRGSRERLHEIFEHNRNLRRQFFADLPKSNPEPRLTRHSLSHMNLSDNFARKSLDGFKQTGIGYGSTETIGSQSNQSAVSSINSRKSHYDTSQTPEPLLDGEAFLNIIQKNGNVKYATLKRQSNDYTELSEFMDEESARRFNSLPKSSSLKFKNHSNTASGIVEENHSSPPNEETQKRSSNSIKNDSRYPSIPSIPKWDASLQGQSNAFIREFDSTDKELRNELKEFSRPSTSTFNSEISQKESSNSMKHDSRYPSIPSIPKWDASLQGQTKASIREIDSTDKELKNEFENFSTPSTPKFNSEQTQKESSNGMKNDKRYTSIPSIPKRDASLQGQTKAFIREIDSTEKELKNELKNFSMPSKPKYNSEQTWKESSNSIKHDSRYSSIPSIPKRDASLEGQTKVFIREIDSTEKELRNELKNFSMPSTPKYNSEQTREESSNSMKHDSRYSSIPSIPKRDASLQGQIKDFIRENDSTDKELRNELKNFSMQSTPKYNSEQTRKESSNSTKHDSRYSSIPSIPKRDASLQGQIKSSIRENDSTGKELRIELKNFPKPSTPEIKRHVESKSNIDQHDSKEPTKPNTHHTVNVEEFFQHNNLNNMDLDFILRRQSAPSTLHLNRNDIIKITAEKAPKNPEGSQGISQVSIYDSESEGLRLLNRFNDRITNTDSPYLRSRTNNDNTTKATRLTMKNDNNSQTNLRKSLPNLAVIGQPARLTVVRDVGKIARLSVNGSTIDLSRQKGDSKLSTNERSNFDLHPERDQPNAKTVANSEHRKFPEETDERRRKITNETFSVGFPTTIEPRVDYETCTPKLYAARVHLHESPGEKSSLWRKRYKKIPPPLDLSKISELSTYDPFYDNVLKDYSVDVSFVHDHNQPLKSELTVIEDDRSNDEENDVFETRKNDAELKSSGNISKYSSKLCKFSIPASDGSPGSPKIYLRHGNDGKVRSTNLNKSCGDLSKTIDLRSPLLVNNFRSSMGDISASSSFVELSSPRLAYYDSASNSNAMSPSLDHRKSTGRQSPGTGTTLPSVYGPIPYKSPRRYVEGEVTIHYRSPVRTEAKEQLSEEELARRSAENMRRVYQEERRRKYLQELHDIDSRRHTDNFIPSQKSPIPLNRYDDFVDDLSQRSRSQDQTPEPRLVARALYNFVGQSSRELTFRRGDIIFVRRQVDKNWYEGEHNAMVGLFPFNYVEILPYDGIRTTPKKPHEGQARAKFNFVAQTNLELSLAKGELVVLTRRVDENWYEGRIGHRRGIFPSSYVEVLVEPGLRPETPVQSKPVAAPAAHSLLSNGSAGGKLSMGPHHYTPSIPTNTSVSQHQYNSLPRMGGSKLHVAPVNETLHIDTHSEPLPYRALYNYRPQNEDELELKEGDTVYVMEKCDDGWFVGSSQRTGYFGTFPGNYVERL